MREHRFRSDISMLLAGDDSGECASVFSIEDLDFERHQIGYSLSRKTSTVKIREEKEVLLDS